MIQIIPALDSHEDPAGLSGLPWAPLTSVGQCGRTLVRLVQGGGVGVGVG